MTLSLLSPCFSLALCLSLHLTHCTGLPHHPLDRNAPLFEICAHATAQTATETKTSLDDIAQIIPSTCTTECDPWLTAYNVSWLSHTHSDALAPSSSEEAQPDWQLARTL